MSYIRTLLTREEFFQKIKNRSNSEDSERSARSGISNLDYYCKDVYKKTSEQIFEDIKSEITKGIPSGIALKFLDDFVNWLGVDHLDITWYKNINDWWWNYRT